VGVEEVGWEGMEVLRCLEVRGLEMEVVRGREDGGVVIEEREAKGMVG